MRTMNVCKSGVYAADTVPLISSASWRIRCTWSAYDVILHKEITSGLFQGWKSPKPLPMERFELSLPCENTALNRACLPIPPHRQRSRRLCPLRLTETHVVYFQVRCCLMYQDVTVEKRSDGSETRVLPNPFTERPRG